MSLLDLAEEESAKRGNVRVEAIYLKLGPLSGVVKEALVSAYELASEQTDFATCKLVIEDVGVVGYCPACEMDRAVESIQALVCSECGTPVSNVLQGRELQLTALELAE